MAWAKAVLSSILAYHTAVLTRLIFPSHPPRKATAVVYGAESIQK